MSQLSELKKHTIVVADTGDIDSIKQFAPEDARIQVRSATLSNLSG